MESALDWFLVNPARVMVAVSLLLTLMVLGAEHHGRNTGGSGWLTLARLGIGAIWCLATAIVAAFFGGIGAFFGYLLLQVLVCIVMPMLVDAV